MCVYATMSSRYVYVKYCVFWVGCCITLSCIIRVSRFKQTSVWLKGLNVTTRETKLVSVRRCSVVTLSDDLGEKPLSYQMRTGENKSDTCCELVMLRHPAVIIHSYKQNQWCLCFKSQVICRIWYLRSTCHNRHNYSCYSNGSDQTGYALDMWVTMAKPKTVLLVDSLGEMFVRNKHFAFLALRYALYESFQPMLITAPHGDPPSNTL